MFSILNLFQGTTRKGGKDEIEGAAIPELQIDPAMPPDEFTDLLVRRLEGLNLESYPTTDEHNVILDLWDFAGQHLYYTFYPVFLSSRAVYLLVYNLSKPLNEIAMPCFKRGFLNIPLQNRNRETNLENFLSWLVTIRSICSRPETNETETSYSRPPVFIVGTHADRIHLQDIREMERQILMEISKSDHLSHVVRPLFSVDNTQGSSDDDVAKLQKRIIEVLKEEPYMGEMLPVRYVFQSKMIRNNRLLPILLFYVSCDG